MNVETALLSGYEQDSDGEAIGSSEEGADRRAARSGPPVQSETRDAGEVGGGKVVHKIGAARFPEVVESGRGDERAGK